MDMLAAFRRFLAQMRDAWSILGATVVFVLVLEGMYRAQASVRRALRGPDITLQERRPDHPNVGESWWADVIARKGFEGGGLRYDPFRGWWPREERSRYMNIDADGRRVTMQAQLVSGPPRLVYMFGGSSMWGWIVRDSFTVPSLVASRLRTLGYSDVQVVNFAQSTFDFAQNAATLMQELRHGRVPAVAVFLDGNNEVAPAIQSGEVGHILNEALIARRFERRTTLPSDLWALLQHSELVRRLTQRPAAAPRGVQLRLCDAIAASYSRQVRAMGAVAAANRVQPIFLWQPMRATTNKRLTAWERDVPSPKGWRETVRRCTIAVDSAMALPPPVPYYPLHTLFDHDTVSVFTDDYGHVTEAANAVIADWIAARLAERLPQISRP